MTDRLYSRKQTAQMLAISVRTLERLADELPPVHVTERTRGYRASAIEAYIKARESSPSLPRHKNREENSG